MSNKKATNSEAARAVLGKTLDGSKTNPKWVNRNQNRFLEPHKYAANKNSTHAKGDQ